jgi:hypothetical protein
VLESLDKDQQWNGYRAPLSLSEFFSNECAYVNSKARFVIDVLNMGQTMITQLHNKGGDNFQKYLKTNEGKA